MAILINNVGFSADSKLKSLIEDKIAKLNRFYSRIIDSKVFLKLENSGKVKDKIVEISLIVPDKTIVSKSVNKQFEVALDDCVSSLERQLKKYKQKRIA